MATPGDMKYEVEGKYRLADSATFEARLAALGVQLDAPQRQVDRYFNHPARDFKVTDEAFRIRSMGEANVVTYKGPKLDATIKTRRELELPIAPGRSGADDFATLLELLGFRPVAAVVKTRRSGTITWQGRPVAIALDQVEQVGTFVELEVVAEGDLEAVRACLASLAEKLDLHELERRSYLSMLLSGNR